MSDKLLERLQAAIELSRDPQQLRHSPDQMARWHSLALEARWAVQDGADNSGALEQAAARLQLNIEGAKQKG